MPVSRGLSWMAHNSRAILQLRRTEWGIRLSSGIQTIKALFVFPVCALFLFSLPAPAQSTSQSMPENASAKSYGDGWKCNIGYRLSGDLCAAVIVPENAYPTNRTYGPGWDCHYGFRVSDQTTCVAVIVPDGGFLDPSGERWRCSRGFLKIDDTCQEIVVPANAYLAATSRGSAWECDRGFEALDDLCVAIVVPANAYLNSSRYGQPWTCERGFIEQDGLCEAIVIPENAYFDEGTYGKGWKCERGYAASGTSCEIIDIPANVHLDRSGNRWDCNKNFKLSKGLCVLDN